jgi:uroporphyrinogen decarboxylase
MGNVSPSQTLLEGSVEKIETEVIDCLRQAGDSPKGFILATGCEVPLHTPPASLDTFMAAGKRWGRLPLELPA